MALEFLESFHFKETPPHHRTCHDLESLCLVVIYALLRRVCFEERHDEARRKPALILFETLFGRLAPRDMIAQRRSVLGSLTKSLAPLDKLLDEDLKYLPVQLMGLIEAQNRKRPDDQSVAEGSYWRNREKAKAIHRMITGTPTLPIAISCERFRIVIEDRLEGIFERRAQMI